MTRRLKQSRVARGATIPTPSCWSVFGCTPTVGESVRHEKWRGSASLNQVFNGSVGCKRSAIGRCPACARETRQLWDDLLVQVLGMLSAEGLISLERVTLDGTKIKANAGGHSFRRKEKLEAHLELARAQVRILNAEGEEKETTANRQAGARRRAARQRASRLEAAVREVERLQQEKKHNRKDFVARASSTDPDAHVMRNGEGGTVPSYNVQAHRRDPRPGGERGRDDRRDRLPPAA